MYGADPNTKDIQEESAEQKLPYLLDLITGNSMNSLSTKRYITVRNIFGLLFFIVLLMVT